MATAATPKKAAAPKASAPKKAAPKSEAKASASAASGKTITVVQVGSPIGRQQYQRATLIGLGLNKLHRKSELVDTPSVRGMINAVKHLVKVEEVN